jgi:hypothetical protein
MSTLAIEGNTGCFIGISAKFDTLFFTCMFCEMGSTAETMQGIYVSVLDVMVVGLEFAFAFTTWRQRTYFDMLFPRWRTLVLATVYIFLFSVAAAA